MTERAPTAPLDPDPEPTPAAGPPAAAGPRRHRAVAALAFAAPVVAAAVGGARSTPARPAVDAWYRSLRTPPFQPPPAVFGPVWSVLYATIAGSGYRVWAAPDHPARRPALALWGVQMAANAAWSPVFFGRRAPKVALGILGVQLAATAGYVGVAARVDRPAAAMLAPYLAWTGFAGVLNEEIVRRNPDV